MTIVYDAGVLVAADRNHRGVWADHRIRLELGEVPTTTAPVLSQVSRSDRQVQLRRFLRGCEVVAFSPEQSHEVGSLLAQGSSTDVVDAHLVVIAAASGASVLTSDTGDIRKLARHLPTTVVVRHI